VAFPIWAFGRLLGNWEVQAAYTQQVIGVMIQGIRKLQSFCLRKTFDCSLLLSKVSEPSYINLSCDCFGSC